MRSPFVVGRRAAPHHGTSGRGRMVASRLAAYQSGGLLVALLVLSGVFTVLSGNFLTRSNLLVVLLQVSIVGLVAVPGSMLVLSQFVDLSVGSVSVLAAAVFGVVVKLDHQSIAVGLIVALAAGAGWGLMNGVLISYLDFSPIIVTLGGYAAARGVAEAITHDVTQYSFGNAFGVLGNGEVGGVPVPAIIFLATFAAGTFIWYEMPIGRHMMATGADKAAARSLGVSVRRIPTVLYICSGFAAAAGGLIFTSELDASSLSIGVGLELQVLTAILLGGVAFTGGRGSLWGVLFGVLFVGVLNDGLILINVGPYYANLAVGAVLIVAAGADAFYQRLERMPVRVEELVEENATPGTSETREADGGT